MHMDLPGLADHTVVRAGSLRWQSPVRDNLIRKIAGALDLGIRKGGGAKLMRKLLATLVVILTPGLAYADQSVAGA